MKNNFLLPMIKICFILIGIAFLLLNVLVPFELLYHPILNFLLIEFVLFGSLSLVISVKNKSVPNIFISGLAFGLSSFYVVIMLVNWWVALIIAFMIFIIFGILSISLFGNKTEEIAINSKPDYKNYKEKEKEKTEEKVEEKPLPKIKSFKD